MLLMLDWVLLLLAAFGSRARSMLSDGNRPRIATALPPPDGAEPRVYLDRMAILRKRAAGGMGWLPDLLLAGAGDHAQAIARWIGIESGGNVKSATSMGERGLMQLTEANAKEMGLTHDEWVRLSDPSQPRAWHAAMCRRIFNAYRHRAERFEPFQLTPAQRDDYRTWVAKMLHGLPLLVAELSAQDLLSGDRRVARALALQRYHPSARVLSFALPGHPDAVGVLARFMATADVVAGG